MRTVAQIVADDLCIGCGLCESLTNGQVKMAMTASGALRPTPVDGFEPEQERAIIDACPGVVAEARADPDLPLDPIWGHHGTMRYAWAANPEVRPWLPGMKEWPMPGLPPLTLMVCGSTSWASACPPPKPPSSGLARLPE